MIGPGGTPPPGIEGADLLAGTFVDEPTLILLPHTTGTEIADDGTLVAADMFETVVRAHGAQSLTDLGFPGPPHPGWLATIDALADAVRITGPGIIGEVYTGTLPPIDAAWLDRVAERERLGRGIVLITGSGTPATVHDMIAAGRASWVRISVALADRPGAGAFRR